MPSCRVKSPSCTTFRQHQRQIRILRQPLAGKGDNLGPVALHQIPGLARRHHLGPDGLPVGITTRPIGVVVGVDHLQHRLAADPFNELVQLAGSIRRPGRPHHRHPLGPEIDHGVFLYVVVIFNHVNRAAHLLEGDPRRPHAATPETRHQHHSPGQCALYPTFHHLAPSNQPPPRHPCGKPGLLSSGQKIRGICEGKMRLCEEKVKSGGSQKKTGGNWQRNHDQYGDLLVREIERGKGSKRNDNTDSGPSP